MHQLVKIVYLLNDVLSHHGIMNAIIFALAFVVRITFKLQLYRGTQKEQPSRQSFYLGLRIWENTFLSKTTVLWGTCRKQNMESRIALMLLAFSPLFFLWKCLQGGEIFVT